MSGPSLLQYLDSADRGGGPGGQQRRGCEVMRLENAGELSGGHTGAGLQVSGEDEQGGQGYYLDCFEVRGSGRQAQDRVGGWLEVTCCEEVISPGNIVVKIYLEGGESGGRAQVRIW